MQYSELQINQGNLLSDLKEFPKNLKQRNRIFFYFGNCLLFLFIIFLSAFAICQYSIYELCHWLKPGKFTFSFAMYVFTLGWYFYYLKDSLSERTLKILTWTLTIIISLEMIIMIAQSWMASTTYLSLQIPPSKTHLLLETLYTSSNLLILTTMSITLFIAAQFFRPIQLQPIYLWSIRASFLIFFLSCILGILMMIHYGQTSTDSTNLNIPFTQFSTVRSNLISMHFLGIHCMQLIPFMTYYLPNYLGKKFLLSITTVYSLACFFLFSQIKNLF